MVDLFELLIGKEGEKDYKKKGVIVQGITGKFGSFHTQQMLAYGTNIVAGVTPRKGGQKLEGIPIYESMREAVAATSAKISMTSVIRFTGRKFDKCIRIGSPSGAHSARKVGFSFLQYRSQFTKLGITSMGRLMSNSSSVRCFK